MTCPPEVSRILLAILGRGLVRIRSMGWGGRPDVCAFEADHLHNIPDLIADYSDGRLLYYWQLERSFYRTGANGAEDYFADLWEELRPLAEAAEASSPKA